MSSAILAVVEDAKVENLLGRLRVLDQESPMLGLRAFVWNVGQMI